MKFVIQRAASASVSVNEQVSEASARAIWS